MHIAIDGLDGAGKTTAAREVARRLGFSYVEKPLSAVSDPEGGLQEYLRFTSYINLHTDLEFRAMIYGAGTYLAALRARTENIVSDRYICSMYAINATGENETFFDYLVETSGKPELTVLLFADAETRRLRIIRRDPQDPVLRRLKFSDDGYLRMRSFVDHFRVPCLWLDTTKMEPGEVAAAIIEYWTQLTIRVSG